MQNTKRNNPGLPVLVVETGNALKQTEDLDHPMNVWIVQALERMGVHAVHATVGELRRLNRMTELGRIPEETAARYVATRIRPTPETPFEVRPYVIQSLSAGEGDEEIRIGVLGISSFTDDAAGVGESLGIRECLERQLPAVEAQSDLVVLLARMRDSDLVGVARMFPGIDVIINGSPVGEGREIGKVGNTLIVESAHDGIALGTIELEWDAQGHIGSSRNLLVPLPPMVEESPEMAEVLRNSQRELQAIYRELAEKSPPVPPSSLFAGAGACKSCHEEAHRVWEKSAHAHAIDSLASSSNEYTPDCLPCHVTAFEAEGGFVNMLRTPDLANVQCEACHSAALAHAMDPESAFPGIGLMQQARRKVRESQCLRCHTQENSPRFDFEHYWPLIEHE